VVALIVAAQRLLPGKHNVYLIFRYAFFNLLAGVNLYAPHHAQYLDLYRYSPSFALAFGPLAVLPLALGIAGWCALNYFALYAAVRRLLPDRQATLVLLLILLDLTTSVQNSQSNPLVAALIIAAFLAYEHGHAWRGAWAVAAGTAVKIFPAGAAVFGLLHGPRARSRALVAGVVVFAIVAVLPLPVTGPAALWHQYAWWIGEEGAKFYKPSYSVMGLLDAWTGRTWPPLPIELTGVAALLLPLALRRDAWDDAALRRLFLCSLLCFSVLFNHAAESPSYIIAITGIAVWYAAGPRLPYQRILLILTLLLVTAQGDLIPGSWKDLVLTPARARVIPVLAAWIAMQVEVLRWRRTPAGAASGAPTAAPGSA